MNYRTVQGHRVPSLGFGTFQLDDDEAYEGVLDALELGYRHIDTAQIYKNEGAVGRALESAGLPRDEVFVTTKVWRDELPPEDVLRTTTESLERLRLEAVDLLLIHWPHDEVPLGETLGAFRQLQQEGKTRLIGVSNFTPKLVQEARQHADIACNQVEYHPFLDQSAVLATGRAADMVLTAYSPLARGEAIDDPTLREIASAHGKSAAQVALRWLAQQEGVCAIPKASSHGHRKANFEIFDFQLSGAEMERIHGLARGQRLIDPDFAPDWAS